MAGYCFGGGDEHTIKAAVDRLHRKVSAFQALRQQSTWVRVQASHGIPHDVLSVVIGSDGGQVKVVSCCWECCVLEGAEDVCRVWKDVEHEAKWQAWATLKMSA